MGLLIFTTHNKITILIVVDKKSFCWTLIRIFLLQEISKGKVGNTDIKDSVVIIMGALVHKLCQKGGCNLPVSFAAHLL